jgi:hypothetical protein
MNTRFLRRRAAGVLAALLVAFCFAGTALVHAGEVAVCPSTVKERALILGHEAQDRGEFRLAAECYRIAEEPLLADRALAQRFARTSAAAGQGMSDTIDAAKQQARTIRDSLRRR